MPETKTPRTDAQTRQGRLFVGNDTYLSTFRSTDGAQDGWVPAEHARSLELECASLTEKLEAALDALQDCAKLECSGEGGFCIGSNEPDIKRKVQAALAARSQS